MNFKVGDYVTGTKEADDRYSITTDKALMIVRKISSDKKVMYVEVLEYYGDGNYNFKDKTYDVNPEYFVKVTKDYSGGPITKVIFSGNKTIVFWNDSTKTIVTCAEDDQFSKEAGIAFACMKKYLGDNTTSYHDYFKRFIYDVENDS